MPQPLHDTLPSRALDRAGLARFLDGLVCTDGRLRLFFGGAEPAALLSAGWEELRAISGGVMAVGRGRADPRFPLSLADGESLSLPVTPARSEVLAGRRVLMVMRNGESPEALAEGLLLNIAAHAAEAVLVVNRQPRLGGAAAARDLARLLPEAIQLVWCDLALPAGDPGLGPESHPYLAPDAPGKDRMEVPAADPWASPFAETILFEVMKWRWLAEARSVISLDASDLLPRPERSPTAFEMAERHGMIALAGQRIYPWRLRPGASARFGDHICRMFDSQSGSLRWACAPARIGLERSWRPGRITGMQPRHGLPFLRAMALRARAQGGMPLAPRSALIEDPSLLARALQLGHQPVRPPSAGSETSAATPAGVPPAPDAPRVAIVTCMKNEGPFILEWLAWHRAIGVSDFLVYTNDCTDGTDTMLDLLQAKGLVQHRDNPWRGTELKPQHAALQAAEDEPVMRECDWGISMDVDEFIDIKVGDGRLPTLFAAMEERLPGVNMIAMTWRLFGNGEIDAFEDAPITGQFTRCAFPDARKPHQAWGFKTLFRNIAIYRKLGVHRPKGLRPEMWEQIRWANGSGQPLPREMFRNGWRSTSDSVGYDLVQLNHYAVRSTESFLVKRDRGRVNHVERDQGLSYWLRMNHNGDQDHGLMRRQAMLQAELARLLADPEIAAAHAHAVACHRARIAALRASPAAAAFHAELSSPRMQWLCRHQRHFGSAVFNAGPEALPQDLHLRDLPPDFFFTVDYAGEAQH